MKIISKYSIFYDGIMLIVYCLLFSCLGSIFPIYKRHDC